ncbi:uncharacterized protein LOC122091222 [Macadamia integrifolia]|uniref:uncharacterized protein LOC122091222 n=1 Tax=Macadamia integrifolia TaxID=60698 RepID=UPI001C4F014C|nr:uncharacterized protein LOC122091222 [Macadamia integrifolia]
MELLHETTSSASPPAPAPAPAASHGCPEYGAPVPWIGLYIAAATMEIHGDDPTEIGEERVRKALKFLGKLELLAEIGDKIKWSWPDKLNLDAVGSAEGDDNV